MDSINVENSRIARAKLKREKVEREARLHKVLASEENFEREVLSIRKFFS